MAVTLVHSAVTSCHHENVSAATVVKVKRKRKMAARREDRTSVTRVNIALENGVQTAARVETDRLNPGINVTWTVGSGV